MVSGFEPFVTSVARHCRRSRQGYSVGSGLWGGSGSAFGMTPGTVLPEGALVEPPQRKSPDKQLTVRPLATALEATS